MDFKDQVKSTVDIVQVVGEYVRLTRGGAQSWKGLCPFHSEKTPSFNVNDSLQIFKCFGCGKGGDVFTFLMEHQGLTFPEALEWLAERNGIPIPKRRDGVQSDESARLRAALLQMHAEAQTFFEAQLRGESGAGAREYLKRRGIDSDTARTFGIGYAPSGSRLARQFEQGGYRESDLSESSLVRKADDRPGFYDFFRDRLIFPIRDTQGRVIAFGARALSDEQQPKYLNSAQTKIYDKRAVLYNLSGAKAGMKKSNRVVLAEGYMDVIGIVRAGVEEAVATCGTALTPEQVRTMRRLADTLIVNFDSDSAGRESAEKSVEKALVEGFHVRVLELPGDLDPDEYVQQHGPEAYRAQLEQAPPYYSWLAERARTKFDLRTAEGRVEAFDFLKPSIHLLPDKIARAALASELAERLGVDPGLVLEEFRRSATDRSRPGPPSAPTHSLSPGERLLLELFLDSEEARDEMLDRTAELAGEEKWSSQALFQALASAAVSDSFEFAAFEGRLEERDREMVARIIFDRDRRKVSIDEGRQAFLALERQSLEKRYRAVRRRISEAEQKGDQIQALEALRERSDLERRLRELEK